MSPPPARRRRTALIAAAAAVAASVAVTASVLAVHALGNDGSDDAPAGVMRADGSVDAAAYDRLARSMASSAGVAYRFGASGDTQPRSDDTAWEPTSKTFRGDGTPTWQVAGPQDPTRNDYSSNQGELGYVTPPGSDSFGVDLVETLSTGQRVFSEKPQLSWTYYGGGAPSPDLQPSGASGRCAARLGVAPGRFVAQARGYAYGEATANAVVVFDNGVVATSGTNTAPGEACTRLPAGLHPTAVSVTNGNEFALVTAWNTTTLRSELVVVALGSARPRTEFFGYDWAALYPGLRNYGRPTFAKVLGAVPLPMAAATAVSAVSDDSLAKVISKPSGGNALLSDLTLSDEANRRSFVTGVNRGTVADAGYAVVTSREEHVVAFVDLQPLFREVTGRYFGTRAAFERAVGDIGLQDRQWPYAFSIRPEEAPVVVTMVRTDEAPTAVAAMLSGPATPRAYVATEDGELHVFSVGGLASEASARAADVVEVGSIPVGANPTGITYVKDRGPVGDAAVRQSIDDTLIVTSRGTRAIQWVRLDGDGGSIVRTLRDSRIVDPIAAEDNNNHGTESYIVSIADYGGRQLLNYRYGPVIFHTNGGGAYGMGPTGRDAFEFGGAYRPAGRPYSISITNVT